MYEVELKVEITEKEREDLITRFKDRGFESKGVTPQNDFYIEAKLSPHGGYDLKRYRQEGNKYIYTEKTWEIAGDTKARREDEREVTKEEMEAAITEYPDAIKIKKDREWFAGNYQDRDVSITIDSVKFDHSPTARYFIEAEIVVEGKNEVKETKKKITDFLAELLAKGEADSLVEAPGMFTMALEKR